jgi:hypothetical protein
MNGAVSNLFLLSTGPSESGEGTLQGTILPPNAECLDSLHACTCAPVVTSSNFREAYHI